VLAALEGAVHGTSQGLPPVLASWTLGLPDLMEAIRSGAGSYSLPARWLILFTEFLSTTLRLAIMGHLIIGVLRLFGFQVFRNTYKPLLATSIVEFWNRFYYYFKELLVDFFFYPTFLALKRARRELRLACAVVAAAGVGNLYYHVIAAVPVYFASGATADRLGGRAAYSALLAGGIVVSMLRERRRREAQAHAGRSEGMLATLRAQAGVWLFYSLLHVWNVGLAELTVGQRLRFLGGLLRW
jgi:hypothetical protein